MAHTEHQFQDSLTNTGEMGWHHQVLLTTLNVHEDGLTDETSMVGVPQCISHHRTLNKNILTKHLKAECGMAQQKAAWKVQEEQEVKGFPLRYG